MAFFTGTGAPTTTPLSIGDVYRDTSTTPFTDYVADGTLSADDWRQTYIVILSANKALVSNSVGLTSTSSTTATEIGYLSGVTSSIQAQFTGKVNTTLDNVASTNIGASLLFSTANTFDIGTLLKPVNYIYAQQIRYSGASEKKFIDCGLAQIWSPANEVKILDSNFHQLFNQSGTLAIDFGATGALYSNGVDQSFNFYNRTLNNASGSVICEWASRFTNKYEMIMDNGSEVQFRESTGNGTSYVGISAPSALAGSYSMKLPDALPVADSPLKIDTSGNWSYFAGASGSFTTVDSKTVTVINGIITGIV
jgi:hypothetical protein